MALARGCSESASAVAATCNNWDSSSPASLPAAKATMLVTAGLPSVSVPVLSNMMGRNQGLTPLLVLAHLDVEYLRLAYETEDGVHLVNVAVLGRPLHTASPNLG